uniref:Uncharacterized protein n=1 Tax=viral metagenome TaxID=1070528 RepID=A0A6M3ITD3_9ZZZZ
MPEKTDHDLLTEVHTVLLGTNGHPGIAKQVERNTKAINKMWVCIAVIASSIGGGVYGIVEILKGM